MVLINHPETSLQRRRRTFARPTPAAIANAVFDATGVRIRRAPLTPARVKAALDAVRSA